MQKIEFSGEFKLQVISDIHLEMRKEIPDTRILGTALALCGDIGNPAHLNYKHFLQWASENYQQVFLISGNHEYYGGYFEDVDNIIVDVVSKFKNVNYLNSQSIILNLDNNRNVRIFGSTLWSRISQSASYCISDYSRIKRHGTRITIHDTIARHQKAVDSITRMSDTTFSDDMSTDAPLDASLDNTHAIDIPTIVLTHHLPSYKCIHKDYTGPRFEILNSAFATDLDYLIKRPIILWAHGHSHKPVDTCINGIRVVSNPLGYPGEEIYTELVIDIDREIDIYNL